MNDSSENVGLWLFSLNTVFGVVLFAVAFGTCLIEEAQASEITAEILGGYRVSTLATAIYYAEGGSRTRWPYGILKRYRHTTPRQACVNTIRSKYRQWAKNGKKGAFLEYLARKYAPIGASNDPMGLNRNWLNNVMYFYNRGNKGC